VIGKKLADALGERARAELSIRSSERYRRKREYPQPPPPSKNTTRTTINRVDIYHLAPGDSPGTATPLESSGSGGSHAESQDFGTRSLRARRECAPLNLLTIQRRSFAPACFFVLIAASASLLGLPWMRS
jgi:hypothetical protein